MIGLIIQISRPSQWNHKIPAVTDYISTYTSNHFSTIVKNVKLIIQLVVELYLLEHLILQHL